MAPYIQDAGEVADDGPMMSSYEESLVAADTNGDEIDVLVVGGGLSGIAAMHRLRKIGLKVKCFEAGESFGGVWYWNRYPGARVDSEFPFYQLNIPEVYKTWHFSERFPHHRELRRYMAHIDKTLNLSKDTYFNARVVHASLNGSGRWTIRTQQGHVASAKYLVLCTGLHHKLYTPDMPGLNKFKGNIIHPGSWPEAWDATGKKIGLVGAGATAVQLTQELGKQADELTVFVRRPSYNLAMKQRDMSEDEQRYLKHIYRAVFEVGRKTMAGFTATRDPKNAKEVEASEREKHFDTQWEIGGLNFALGNYSDTLIDPESNEILYQYWRKRVCERLHDPEKQRIMAPETKPYYFGTKRVPLENDYYEVLNQSNVHIHDLKAVGIDCFTETGLLMEDGKEYTFDAIILATGFDSYTGSLTSMGIKNKSGIDIKDLWQDGVNTYLGLAVSGFPNMFMSYGPHAPTARANAPTLIEAQVETIVDMIAKLEREGAKSIEPLPEAEKKWKKEMNEANEKTLFPFTDSWWNGSNVPGKKVENLTFVEGIGVYEAKCRKTMEGWVGFEVKY